MQELSCIWKFSSQPVSCGSVTGFSQKGWRIKQGGKKGIFYSLVHGAVSLGFSKSYRNGHHQGREPYGNETGGNWSFNHMCSPSPSQYSPFVPPVTPAPVAETGLRTLRTKSKHFNYLCYLNKYHELKSAPTLLWSQQL